LSEANKIENLLSLIEDFAVAVTKRSGMTVSNENHVLVAIDEYQSAHFASLMPGVAAACRAKLAANATDELVEEVDVRLVRRLFGSVESVEEFWARVQSVVEKMGHFANFARSEQLERPARNVLQVNTPLVGTKDDPTNDEFLTWCAVTAGLEESVVQNQVVVDLKYLRQLILGSDEVTSGLSEAEQNQGFAAIFASLRAPSSSGANQIVSRRLAMSYLTYAHQLLIESEHSSAERAREIQDGLAIFLRKRLDEGARRNSVVTEVFTKHFGDLCGLEAVKNELLRHVRALVGQQQRENRGLPAATMTMHLAFLGSPGTGKTEVARRYGRVLQELNLLENGKFHETGKSDFVAKWAGQTEAKTKKLIEKAKGGVLFIDEAYALYEGDREGKWKGYGQEAIEVLVADIENFRKELIVIVAGYAKEMGDFFDTNPGLRSRIPTLVTFADLSLEELTDIGLSMIATEFVVDDSFRPALAAAIAQRMNQKDFGNARGVRNLIDEVRRMQAERLSELGEFVTHAELSTVTVQDIPEAKFGIGNENTKKHPMGYR